MTKRFLAGALLFVAGVIMAPPLQAQGRLAPSQEKLQGKYQKKLQAPFYKKAHWYTDYDQARQAAKKAGRLIFAYFTRSYAY